MTAHAPHASEKPQWLHSAADYTCGVVAGIGKVAAGHPFDTIKGRVQSGHFSSATTALRMTLKHEGPQALYSGVLPPSVSVCFVSGILFHANSRIRSALQPNPDVPLTYAQMAAAGGGAGALTAVVLCPLDAIKVRLQVQHRDQIAADRGRNILRIVDEQGVRGLTRGFVATTLREIGTFGLCFPLNEYFKSVLRSPSDDQSQPLPLRKRLLAAGTAGVLCWLPCYPIDQVKTKLQLASSDQSRSMMKFAADIYRQDGGRGFFKGMAPCLLRAFPAYAAQFALYDALISMKQKVM